MARTRWGPCSLSLNEKLPLESALVRPASSMPWPSVIRTTSSPAAGLPVVEFFTVPVRVWAAAACARSNANPTNQAQRNTRSFDSASAALRFALAALRMTCINFDFLAKVMISLWWALMRFGIRGARSRPGAPRLHPATRLSGCGSRRRGLYRRGIRNSGRAGFRRRRLSFPADSSREFFWGQDRDRPVDKRCRRVRRPRTARSRPIQTSYVGLLFGLLAELIEFGAAHGSDAIGQSGGGPVPPGAHDVDQNAAACQQSHEGHDPGGAIESRGRRSRENRGPIFLHESLFNQAITIASADGGHEFVTHHVGIGAAHVVALEQDLSAGADAHQLMAEFAEARAGIAGAGEGEHGGRQGGALESSADNRIGFWLHFMVRRLHTPQELRLAQRADQWVRRYTFKFLIAGGDWSGVLQSPCRDRYDHRGWGVGHQRQDCAADDDPHTEPDPHHERIQVRFQNRMAVIWIQAFIDDVKIFFQRRADVGHRRRLLAGLVEAALGCQLIDLSAVFVNIKDCPFGFVIWEFVGGVRAADQRVGPYRHFVAIRHFLLFVLIEGRAGQTDQDHRNAEVNDVASVASCIAMRELDHRGEHALSAFF